MNFLKHVLLVLVLTIALAPFDNDAQAGRITCKSTAGVAADTLAVLNFVAQSSDHDLCVTSAFRDPVYNARVGGAGGSQHTKGKAIDLSLQGLTDNQRVKLVREILSHPSVKGFGYYTNSHSLHFDTRPSRTGKGYWGYNYSSSGFDADARAGKIHSIIVGMVYRWSSTGSPGEMGSDIEAPLPPVTAPTAPVGNCPNFNVPLDPNSAEALGLMGSSDTNAQGCAMQRIGSWQAQSQGQGTTQPPPYIPPTAQLPSIPNVMPPSLSGQGTTPGTIPGGSGNNVFPQYPLPGAQPSALSPNAAPQNQPNQASQPNVTHPSVTTPTLPIPQCTASSTPSTAKKLPTMSTQEWDRAVRILYAEAGSCPLGKNDVNCIKVAETFRNRLIYSTETGKYSCYRTWDSILRFTGGSCGYFDKIGIGNATRLQAGSATYNNVSQALFQAIYGGTNFSLGNLHNFTKGYHSNIVNQNSIVPAGNNYTYIKVNPVEQRVDISQYHFPNCGELKIQPDTSQPYTIPPTAQQTRPPTNPFAPPQQSNISPIAQSPQYRNPGVLGAGQGFYNGAIAPAQNNTYIPGTNQPYATSLQQATQAQQQYTTAQNQLSLQQQELLRLQSEQPERQREIATQLEELQKQQSELLKQQLLALQQQQQAAQRKPSGDRPVTIIAAPTKDYAGVILTSLAGKLQKNGHDVIMMPDAASYQPQLDKVTAVVKTLPAGTEVNCIGWNKGALGCVALAGELDKQGHKLNHLVLIDPNEGIDGSSVPGVAAADFANNKVAIPINGKIILYMPEAGSSLLGYEPTDAEAVRADEVYTVGSTLGNLSLGLSPEVQNQIVSRLTAGKSDTKDSGNNYNVDLGAGPEFKQKIVGLQGLLYLFSLSKQEGDLVTPIVLLHWLGNSIGSLFGFSDSNENLTVSAEDVNEDLYLLLIQELLFTVTDDSEPADSDITISALKVTRTLSDQYRFFGSIKRTYSGDEALRNIDSHFNESVTNELLIDFKCDGSIDDGVTFVTPYNTVLATSEGAEATISDYLDIEQDGLHCFMFYADADDVVHESDENNNASPWREFVSGFGAVVDTPSEDLPALKFEVSAYNANGVQVTQDWTSEDITIASGQQIAFRWDAPEYDMCSPLLSSLTADILDNKSTANRNTLTEKIDVEERTGYYEVRCEVNGDTKVEHLHVTVE